MTRRPSESLPARSADLRTLVAMGVVVGGCVGCAAAIAARSDPAGWLFAAAGFAIALASVLLGVSSVSVVGSEVVVRNGWRVRRVPCSLVRRIVAPSWWPGVGDDAPVVGRAAASRTRVPLLELGDGSTVQVWALLVEPSLRTRSVGDHGFEELMTRLASAVRAAAFGRGEAGTETPRRDEECDPRSGFG